MRRVFRALVSYLGLTAALIIGGIVLLDQVIMPRLVSQGWEMAVPDVTSLEFAAAADTLRAAGFSTLIAGHEADPDFPIGVVVRQEPQGGSLAKPSRTVHAFLSSGPARVVVPAILGLGSREALATLAEVKLRTGDVVMARAGWVTAGQVLATYPPPGASVLLGSEVDVLVAGPVEPECYLIPDFVGLRVGDVVQELRARGIPLGRRSYVNDSRVPEGTVFSTNPPAGFRVCRGESLSVVVAS